MKRMGFEGLPYYGAAGAEATNLLTNSRDISFAIEKEYGNTTVRGTGASPPRKTSRPVLVVSDGFEIVMLNDENDALLEAIKVAAKNCTPIAIRLKDHSAGKGFDGDVDVSVSKAWPLGGEQVVTISCMPTDAGGRDWDPYV